MPRKKAQKEFNVPRMPFDPEMDEFLLASMKKCFQCPNFHNTKFLIGTEGKEFKINDTCLAIISPVFREMLFGSEKRQNKIVLTNITPEGFSAVIRHAFSLDPEVDPHNVVEVINAAKKYQVYVLHKLAVNYLESVLDMASEYSEDAKYLVITKFLTHAMHLQIPEVVNTCFTSLCKEGGVEQFLMSKAFTEFSPRAVNLMLGFDELGAEEPIIWTAVMNWAKTQAKKNKTEFVDELKQVYRSVRYPLMDTKYFSQNVVPVQVLTQQEILDLFCYLTYPEGKPNTKPFCQRPRVIWNNVQLTRFTKVAAGELEHDGSSHCLGMQVDSKCELVAVGSFCGDGLTEACVTLWQGNEDEDETRSKLCTTGKMKISAEKSIEPVRLELPNPVILEPKTFYEIEVSQDGPPSHKLKDGEANTTHEQGGKTVTFKWLKPTMETDNSVKKGNIPCVWVRLLSGQSSD